MHANKALFYDSKGQQTINLEIFCQEKNKELVSYLKTFKENLNKFIVIVKKIKENSVAKCSMLFDRTNT